jgi:hypothetical protein
MPEHGEHHWQPEMPGYTDRRARAGADICEHNAPGLADFYNLSPRIRYYQFVPHYGRKCQIYFDGIIGFTRSSKSDQNVFIYIKIKIIWRNDNVCGRKRSGFLLTKKKKPSAF